MLQRPAGQHAERSLRRPPRPSASRIRTYPAGRHGRRPRPSPARAVYDHILTAQQKSREAANAPAGAVYSPPRLWRDADQLLYAALPFLNQARTQAWQFVNHNPAFLECAWESIRQDIIYAHGCLRRQTMFDRNQLPAQPLRPENRPTSVAEVLTAAQRLSSFDRARLLQQLAPQVLNPDTEVDASAQTYIAAASHAAASAAEMLMAIRAQQLWTAPPASAAAGPAEPATE